MIYDMNTCGIIAEYNPFHKGHIYHIKKTRQITQCDCLIAIVSNYFTQRGLPSMLSMQDKTKLALEAGCNLVLELPAVYAAQSADYFAKYAVESLHTLGVDEICFGSETNDIDFLKQNIQDMDALKKDPSISMNQNLYQNLSLQPNDILGIQYIKQCEHYHIQAISIPRNNTFKSATQTRNDFFKGIPQFNENYFIKKQTWETYYPYLRNFLILTNSQDLSRFFLVNEGIEHRLKENAKKHDNWEDFLNASISKTYTKARIQRTCVFLLLQITKEQMKNNDHFNQAIVCGFDSIGQNFIKQKHVITKFKERNAFLQDLEIKCQYLYHQTFQTRKVYYYDR